MIDFLAHAGGAKASFLRFLSLNYWLTFFFQKKARSGVPCDYLGSVSCTRYVFHVSLRMVAL